MVKQKTLFKDIVFYLAVVMLGISITFNFCCRKGELFSNAGYKKGIEKRDTIWQKDTISIKSTKFVTKIVKVKEVKHDTVYQKYDSTDNKINIAFKTIISDTLSDSLITTFILDTLQGSCKLESRDFRYKLNKPITIETTRVDTLKVKEPTKPKLKDQLKPFGYGVIGGIILTLISLLALN